MPDYVRYSLKDLQRFYSLGSRPSRRTLIRWIVDGVRGKRLAARRDGGRWTVSQAAWLEFEEHLEGSTRIKANVHDPTSKPCSHDRHDRATTALKLIEAKYGSIYVED